MTLIEFYTEIHPRALLIASLVGAPCDCGSGVVDVLNEKSSGVPPNMASHCSRVYIKDQQNLSVTLSMER